MEIPKVVALLVILCFIQTAISLKITKKSHTMPRNSLRDFDREDGRLLYVACKPGFTRHEKKCQVIGERSIERPDTRACNVTLTTTKKPEMIEQEVAVHRLGQNKAILFWQVVDDDFGEELYSVITVVDLESCKIGEIRFDYRSEAHEVLFVPYGDRFEVFFAHEKICGDDMCRMVVDDNGKLIKGPVPFFKDHDEPMLLKSISENSAEKGYFYVKRTDDDTFYILVNSDGSQKHLSKYPGDPKIYASTSHDWITVCATYNGDKKYINCTQYDSEGNFQFETQLKKTTADTQVKFVHNVREGGFFLAYFTSSSCQSIQSCIRNLNNLLAKFDAGGKLVGNKAETKTNYIWDTMFENKAGDYCVFKNSFFADTVIKKDGRNRMRITHDCYTETDFRQ